MGIGSLEPKIAILVLGPESSGTRLATSILLAAGCYGSAEHEQPFDEAPPTDQDPVVWRRSFPHRGRWPSIPDMVEHLHRSRYAGRAVVMVREQQALVASQLAAPHVQSRAEALANIQHAYWRILAGLTGCSVPYQMLPYEALVLHQQPVLDGVLDWCELAPVPDNLLPEIVDGNHKHYRGYHGV